MQNIVLFSHLFSFQTVFPSSLFSSISMEFLEQKIKANHSKVARKGKSWTSFKFKFKLSTFYLASILFTRLKFTCVNARSQKRVSGNQYSSFNIQFDYGVLDIFICCSTVYFNAIGRTKNRDTVFFLRLFFNDHCIKTEVLCCTQSITW